MDLIRIRHQTGLEQSPGELIRASRGANSKKETTYCINEPLQDETQTTKTAGPIAAGLCEPLTCPLETLLLQLTPF